MSRLERRNSKRIADLGRPQGIYKEGSRDRTGITKYLEGASLSWDAPTGSTAPKRTTKGGDEIIDTLRLRLETRFRDLRDAFRHIDRDNSGSLSRDEVEAGITELGVSSRHINALMSALDTNCDGLVSFAEFSAALRPPAESFGARQSDRFVTGRHVIPPGVAGGQVLINDNLGTARATRSGQARPDSELMPLPSARAAASPRQLDDYTSNISNLIYAKHGKLRDAFRSVDVNKDGRLSQDELKRAMRTFNLPIPEQHVEQLFAQLRGRDGQVDYEAFANALKRKDALGN